MSDPTAKRSLRSMRRREEQIRLGIIQEGEPEYPPSGTYSSYYHGVAPYVQKMLRKKLLRAAGQYVRATDPDKKRTARGIVRGMAISVCYITNPVFSTPPPESVAELEATIIAEARAIEERKNQ